MSLLDRLRPRWHHSDPQVRVAAVRELGREEHQLLAAVAEHDEDARVRRAAIKKLADAAALLAVADRDPEEALRRLARERAVALLTDAAMSDGDVGACERALARLSDTKPLAAVAIGAAHPAVRSAALARVTDERCLADIARQGRDPATRLAAVGRITDASLLRRIASAEGPAEIAQAALERIENPEILHAIAEDVSSSKRVRQAAQHRLDTLIDDDHPIRVRQRQARQLALCAAVEELAPEADPEGSANAVRDLETEWHALAARTPPAEEVALRFRGACRSVLDEVERQHRLRADQEQWQAQLEDNRARAVALCERMEGLGGGEDAPARLEGARAAWRRLGPLPEGEAHGLGERFDRASRDAAQRQEGWLSQAAFHERVERVVRQAETAAAASEMADATAVWPGVASRWRALGTPPAGARWTADEEPLRQRFEAAAERLRQRQEEALAAEERQRHQNLAQLAALCGRLEALGASAELDPRAVDQGLRALKALGRMPPLPPAESRRVWQARLANARRLLLERLSAHRDSEAWRRWANADVQEALIQRVEALLETNDLAAAARELGQIQEEWKRFAEAPREQSQDLWERFRTARDELRRRCAAFFADNLARKEALCARVEALAESTDWTATAEEIKRIQAEWKEIGPVAPRVAKTVWERFRAPCDRFFTRRAEHFAALKTARTENAGRLAALCERAESLAESIEWDATTEEIKRLQGEWKQVGPTTRKESEALWQRFRAACDRFFDRRRRRRELELEARVARAAAVCERLEALAGDPGDGGAAAGDDVVAAVKQALAEWAEVGALPADQADALGERFGRACDRVVAAHPDGLRGTALDPDAGRKRREKLCTRLEDLVRVYGPAAPPDTSLTDLALRLKQTWAANTIGGGPARRKNWQAATDEVERLRAAWDRLGPVVGFQAQALARRFEAAYGSFLTARRAAPRGGGDRPPRAAK
jgi:hypothetical protein